MDGQKKISKDAMIVQVDFVSFGRKNFEIDPWCIGSMDNASGFK